MEHYPTVGASWPCDVIANRGHRYDGFGNNSPGLATTLLFGKETSIIVVVTSWVTINNFYVRRHISCSLLVLTLTGESRVQS
jgi:hypothetical protein